MRFDPVKYKQRLADVEVAIETGLCYADLADLWGVSVPGAWYWCQRRIPPEKCAKISEAGKLRSGTPYRSPAAEDRALWTVQDRLELLKLCRDREWTDAKIARAMGLRPSALCEWVKRNAPDGIEDALSDYADELQSERAA